MTINNSNTSTSIPDASSIYNLSEASYLNMNERMQNDSEVAPKKEKELTFDAFLQWHKHLFEKLGWMILCRNDKLKITAYKTSIAKFIEAADNTLYVSPDKQTDLHIMRDHISILQKHVEKDFPSRNLIESNNIKGGARGRNNRNKSKSKDNRRSKSRRQNSKNNRK